MYLYAASTRKRSNAGPAATARISENASHTICFCASCGDRRATTASPIDDSTIASAGSVSSRDTFAGRIAGHASASSPSANGSHAGSSASRGASRTVNAAMTRATTIGAHARRRTSASVTRR